jgi:hypothetical protein
MPQLMLNDVRGTGLTVNGRRSLLSLDDLRLSGPDVQGSVARVAFRLDSFGLAGTTPITPLVATGTVALDGLDLLLPDVEPVKIAVGQMRAELAETRFAMEAGTPRINGGLALDTHKLSVSIQEKARHGQLPPPTRIEAARLSFDVPAVAVAQGNAGSAQVSVDGPLLKLDELRLGGPDIQGSVGTTVIQLSRTDIAATEPGSPFVASGTIRANRLNLLVPDIEPVGIIAQEFDAKLNQTRFSFPAGRVLIDGAVALDTRELLITIQEQARAGKSAPPPIRISAKRFAGEVPRLAVDDSRATGTKVTVITPRLTLDQFRLVAPTEPGTTMQLAAPTLTLQGVDVNVIDAATLDVSGRANVLAPSLSFQMAGTDGVGQIGGLGLDLQRFSYRETDDTSGFGMQGRIELGSLRGRIPADEPGQPSDIIALAGLKLDVADVDVTMDGREPKWRARLDLGLKSLAATLRAPLSLIANVADISLRGFDGSSAPEYMLDSLTIGRLDASLKREAKATVPPPPDEPDPATRSWPPTDLPIIRLGLVQLIDGGKISFVDRAVTPPVLAALDVETLRVENVDTTDPDARTDVQIKARLDDALIDIQGWAKPFQSKPSLAVQAQLDNLRLATLSPYFAPLIGIDVLRGSLTVGAAGTVTAGQLDGEVKAQMVGVRMSDRRKTGTNQPPRSIGEPLSTLIRLIEDSKGSIEVAMPVRGDVLSPEFGYSDAVWALVPRVLRALVTSPVSFISASRSLMRAANPGGGEAAEALIVPPEVQDLPKPALLSESQSHGVAR